MSRNLFILHFQPLEGYPPILNLLDYLSPKKEIEKIYCTSTSGNFNKLYKNNTVSIFRFGRVNKNKISTWFSYFYFNIINIILLTIIRPNSIIYYETISSFPIYIYKKYINKKVNVYIHYHEYTTKKEYSTNKTIKFYHALEVKLYPEAKWISHTNETRLSKFLTDNKLSFDKEKHHISPNYPSKKWGIKNTSWNGTDTLKFVFVGYSVSPESSFITEIIEWIAKQKQHSILDIYCLKQDSLPTKFIGKQGNTTITIKPSVSYSDLPQILKKYHIGLILYRGLTPNYIHNAPNKLFEYFACGLDVWYPKEMLGIKEYETEISPKVIEIDFNNLTTFEIKKLLAFKSEKRRIAYHAEDIYKNLIEAIK